MLQSKIDGANVITGINTWAVSWMRYSASFLDWTRDELRTLDRKTRKYLAINNAFHPRDIYPR